MPEKNVLYIGFTGLRQKSENPKSVSDHTSVVASWTQEANGIFDGGFGGSVESLWVDQLRALQESTATGHRNPDRLATVRPLTGKLRFLRLK